MPNSFIHMFIARVSNKETATSAQRQFDFS